MEEHFETYDGEEKMDLISPIIRNVEFKGDANNFGKMKFTGNGYYRKLEAYTRDSKSN